MTLFALDTNTVSYFLRNEGRVAEKLLARAPSSIALPSVVLYELVYGAGRSAVPRGLLARLDDFIASVTVLPLDQEAARVAARLRLELERAGSPIGPLDVLIAGTALAHRATLVTRNVREFSRVTGLRVVDWY